MNKQITPRRYKNKNVFNKKKLMRYLNGGSYNPRPDIPIQALRKWAPITVRLDELLVAGTGYEITFSQIYNAIRLQIGLVDGVPITFKLKNIAVYVKPAVTATTSQPGVSCTFYSLVAQPPVGIPNSSITSNIGTLAELNDQGTIDIPAKVGYRYPSSMAQIGLVLQSGVKHQPVIGFSGTGGCQCQLFFYGYYCTKAAAIAP